ncbi:MAG: NFACT RNA binding domain-containing protein [bacterium]
MINLDSLALKLLVTEYNDSLTGGRVQKVQQPSKNELLITIRSKGGTHKLYINVNAKYPHIAVLSKTGEKQRNFKMPDKPPMFCMLLRKYMENAKINNINQPENERIIEIYFESYNELGDRVGFVLAVELMGKHSNIILYSEDKKMISGCVRPISAEKSRERELAGGMPYVYPPKQNKLNLLNIPMEEFIKSVSLINLQINSWMNKTFHNISLALANELCSFCEIQADKTSATSISSVKFENLYETTVDLLKLQHIRPSISADNSLYSLFATDRSIDWADCESVNSMVDEYFGRHIYNDLLKRLRDNLSSTVKKELKKLKTKRDEYLKKIDSSEKEEKYRQYGDLILANIYRIKQGEAKVTLENLFDENKPVEITLDPLFNANDNAQKYYKLYNKAKGAARVSLEFLEKAENEIKYLETVLLSIEQAQTIIELSQVNEELAEQGLTKVTPIKESKKKKPEKEKMSVFDYISKDNYKILIGKNNKQNDYIVSKLSFPNDIWVHTQNMPGSHILIKTDKDSKEEVPQSTIEEAVLLAAYFSKGRDSSKVPIIMTKRKFLKKPPAAKPGFVIYSNETTFYATPDISLLDAKQLEKINLSETE